MDILFRRFDTVIPIELKTRSGSADMAGIESKFNAIMLRLGKLRRCVGSSHHCLASCISGSVRESQYRVYLLEIRAADLHNMTSVMLLNLGRISYPKPRYACFY
jgi:hypothetical protein